MCGVLPFDVSMTARLTMGYCHAALLPAAASLLRLPEGSRFRAQQYHFSEATADGLPAVIVDARTGGGAGLRGVEHPAFSVQMEVRPLPRCRSCGLGCNSASGGGEVA